MALYHSQTRCHVIKVFHYCRFNSNELKKGIVLALKTDEKTHLLFNALTSSEGLDDPKKMQSH